MALKLDPEFEAIIAPMFAAHPPPPSLTNGDAANAHHAIDGLMSMLMSFIPPSPNVKQSEIIATTEDGYKVIIYAHHPASTQPGPLPAILFLHGGGFVGGTAKIFNPAAAKLAENTSRPVYNIEYRLAPAHPYPTPIEDVYTALAYLQTNAASLNIDPARIAVYGESAGGNLAIATALLARNRSLSPPLAGIVAAYPMIDDRTTEMVPKEAAPFIAWKELDNATGWKAYLGDPYGKDDVSAVAAPARAKDLKGLPPTYIDVGGLDLFLDEDVKFASRLMQAGVPTELHVWPGLTHGFEGVGGQITAGKACWAARWAALKRV